MIEKYYYSIPKWKKIVYAIFITFSLLSLISIKTQSGLFSWAAQEITDNITNEIFESVNQGIAEGVGMVLDCISNIFTDPWGPQLETFGNNTNLGGANAVQMIEKFGVWVGVFVATLIYFFSMFVYFFSGKITDSKDTPISLTVKYAVAMAACYKLETVISTFLSIIDKINEGYVKNALAATMGDAPGGFLRMLGEAIDGWFKEVIGEAILSALIPGVHIIIIIFSLFLIWKIVKGLIKLYAEMISRYILSCFSVMLFGGFVGTIVSNNTSQIFKSYIRSLFGTFFVLLFNILWFKVCILTLIGLINSRGILQYFFLLELMAFGLKLDGYLRSMGLNVAASGSRIASACGGSARNLAQAMKGINDLRKGGGNMLKEKGAAMAAKGDANGQKLFNLGSKLGAGTGQGDILKGKQNSENGLFNMASTLGANGMKINDNMVSGSQAADIMSKAMKNPADKDAQNAMKALSSDKLAEGAQALVGDKYKVNSAGFVDKFGTDGQRHSGVKISASPVGADGSEGKSFTGTISGNGMYADGAGESFGSGDDALTMQKDAINNTMSKGESVAASSLEDFGGSVAAEALDSAQGLDFTDGQIESMGKSADGENAFRCFDSEGNMCGTIQGDDFIANASNDVDGNHAADSMLDNAKYNIESMGYECGDFEPVAGQEGVYQATATDEDGNSKTFTATDRGVYTDSRLNSDTESFRVDGSDDNGNYTSMNINAGNYRETSSASNGSSASGQEYGSGDSGRSSSSSSHDTSTVSTNTSYDSSSSTSSSISSSRSSDENSRYYGSDRNPSSGNSGESLRYSDRSSSRSSRNTEDSSSRSSSSPKRSSGAVKKGKK